jgi:hypothetical protein
MENNRRSEPSAKLLTTAEAADYLGLSRYMLEYWRSRGRGLGPCFFKLHRKCVRYSVEDLDAWRRGQRVVPSGNQPQKRLVM